MLLCKSVGLDAWTIGLFIGLGFNFSRERYFFVNHTSSSIKQKKQTVNLYHRKSVVLLLVIVFVFVSVLV